MDAAEPAEPEEAEEPAEQPAAPEAAEPEAAAEAEAADEEMPPEEVKEEVQEEVKAELDDMKLEPVALKTEVNEGAGVAFVVNEKVLALIADDNDWYPGTISKVTQESGRVEYSVKWDECDTAAGEEEETDGFTAAELKPRGSEAIGLLLP